MIVRSDRLLSLLLLLQARGRTTAPEAARELEVSVRTVYRDVTALSAAGVPVYTEQGRGGGIQLMPGYRTDVSGLTAAESRAIVALTGQALPDDLGLGTALASAVRKLVAAVPASQRGEAERVRGRVLVDHTGWYRTTPPTPHLPEIQSAVWADRRLRVRYRHGDGAEGRYLLDPYGLVVKAGVWYLIAGHRRRPGVFRVDRVTDVDTLDAASTPSDVDLPTLWRRLRAQIESPRDVAQVRLRVRPDTVPFLLRVTAVQRVDGEDGEPAAPAVAGPDGRVELRLGFRSLAAARGVLAGFGDEVEVVDPEELRAQLLATARRLVALYAPDPS